MNGHVKRAAYTYAIARPFHPSHLWGFAASTAHLYTSSTTASSSPSSARCRSPRRTRLHCAPDSKPRRSWRRSRGPITLSSPRSFAHSVTLPFRLATIHQSEQRVVEMMRTGHERFRSALAQLDGRVEVGVKIYSDLVASSPASAGSVDGGHSDGSADAGRHYLRRRRQQLHDRDDARRSIAAAAARIGDTLARLSVDHRYHRPQDPRLSGVTEENVLNAAYLIDGSSIDAFAALARSLDVAVAR